MIPDSISIQLPILRLLEDKKSHHVRDVIEKIAEHFKVSSDERAELTPVAQKSKFETRVFWAVSQLRNSGLLENTERGIFKITKRGLEVLEKDPKIIDNSLLKQFPEYRAFLGLDSDKSSKSEVNENIGSPLEILENNYRKLKQDLLQGLLSQIKKIDPYKFERIVVKLLLKMGYGGPSQIGLVTQKSRDSGIDGIINLKRYS
jgi:restriction system protein